MKRLNVAMILTASLIAIGSFAIAQVKSATPSDNVRVTFNYPESAKPISISATKGQQFTISLVSNITTGYSWKMASALNAKTLTGPQPEGTYISPKVEPDKEPMAGAPGRQEWTFTAIGKGTLTLQFNYARPWEKDTPPIKAQVFKVTVK